MNHIFRLTAKLLLPLVVVAFCSCTKSPVNRIERLTEQVEDQGEDWTVDQWEAMFREALITTIAFYEGRPDKEKREEYEEALNDLDKAMREYDSDVRKKQKRARKRKSLQYLENLQYSVGRSAY